MFVYYPASTFVFLSLLIVPSIEQGPLPYTDGYRASCKLHLNGNVNLILSAPHGGSAMPFDVPDRTVGGCRRQTGANAGRCTWIYDDPCQDGQRCPTTVVQDTLSDEFAENVANELAARWNLKPYVIIGKWNRKKVDFNREIYEATLSHPQAMLAHQSYHSNIEKSINEINHDFGKGLLIDIHGQSAGNYTMIGYLLTAAQLDADDLSQSSFSTSIESLCRVDRNACIRGSSSFGTILEENGLGTVYPSMAHPKPGSLDFYSGGYITYNYIPKINALQTELPFDVRNGANRKIYAKNFAQAIVNYMKLNNLLS